MNNTIANPFQEVANRLGRIEELMQSFTDLIKPEPSTRERTYTVPQLCDKYSLAKATIYKHYANGEGKLKGKKTAGKLFFLESDVVEWLTAS